MKENKTKIFLPTSKTEMSKLGWQEVDIILISGDAYVDHPSFSASIIGRYLQYFGYKVGIIAQPDITNPKDFLKLGEPRLFWGITSGNMDSMVNHYTAQNKLRSSDAYTPKGTIGIRPDRALLKYTNLVKQVSKDKPVILGGIEASMRRIPHYDYWSNKIRNSILVDSKADILVYGMGEKIIVDIANRLNAGDHISTLQSIKGTVVISSEIVNKGDVVTLPDQNSCKDKDNFLTQSQIFQKNFNSATIYQKIDKRYLRHNPPYPQLTTNELDLVYSLPFVREAHPMYRGENIKAWDQIKDSITAHRGCGGGCNFCAIGYHQGKKISFRSKKSIVSEVKELVKTKSFHGTISDVGGPSANMYGMKCTLPKDVICKKSSCLSPVICPNLDTNHSNYIDLLNQVSAVQGVKNVFIASGIRFDLALRSQEFIKSSAQRYIGGHLKLAPEHTVPKVLKLMNKPSIELYETFSNFFSEYSSGARKHQQIIPYIIVGHPGTNLADAVKLALYLKKNRLRLEQVQEFYPTPMTPSTVMYYTEKNIADGKPVPVAKGREIRLQKALVQWFIPGNKRYVIEALRKLGKMELIEKFYGAAPAKSSNDSVKQKHSPKRGKAVSGKKQSSRRNRSR
ncbi:MAG: YgiQ family radical SAM protein [Candidatus Cloacimonetes bacterium 4572_65]|nr:MAG: YgiQ family radical SAM protein [Candidatus Cloacimonetes bacterium 4572_65]